MFSNFKNKKNILFILFILSSFKNNLKAKSYDEIALLDREKILKSLPDDFNKISDENKYLSKKFEKFLYTNLLRISFLSNYKINVKKFLAKDLAVFFYFCMTSKGSLESLGSESLLPRIRCLLTQWTYLIKLVPPKKRVMVDHPLFEGLEQRCQRFIDSLLSLSKDFK